MKWYKKARGKRVWKSYFQPKYRFWPFLRPSSSGRSEKEHIIDIDIKEHDIDLWFTQCNRESKFMMWIPVLIDSSIPLWMHVSVDTGSMGSVDFIPSNLTSIWFQSTKTTWLIGTPTLDECRHLSIRANKQLLICPYGSSLLYIERLREKLFRYC